MRKNRVAYSSLYDATGPRFFIISIPMLDEESNPIHEGESHSFIVNQTGNFDVVCSNYLRLKGSLCVIEETTTLAQLLRTISKEEANGRGGGFME